MDDGPKATGLPHSLINGRLEGIGFPDLIWNVCRRRGTGVLTLSARGHTKKVYVDRGRIVFAASSDADDRLGVLLLRDGTVTLEQLDLAASRLSTGRRLGTLLVEAGHLTPDGLVRGVLAQVRLIVLGLFPLEEGEYHFAEGPLPTEEVITLRMKTAEILLQGVRQVRSFTRIRRSVGSSLTRFRLDAGWESTLDGLEVCDGERMLLQRISEAGSRGATVESLCHEVFLSNFEIYRALWAFTVLGVIHEVERDTAQWPATAFDGWLDRVGLPEILVRLCRDGETGVLHVSRGPVERTFHLKDGTCTFATSSAIDDGLVQHLLRRGVISLRNCEETARRLLSNKRVGTILLEMGVIDEGDLRATMREQLQEIIFDTFRWESGDYRFVSGELPTIEQITLDRTVEDLVFEGVRRVTAWSRVREGCGGPGVRLVLLPEYLTVLDRTTVGPDEWELVSLLREPKTVEDICRESVLGSFRSCQILWALRLTGAVGVAPAASAAEVVPEVAPEAAVEEAEAPRAHDTPIEAVVEAAFEAPPEAPAEAPPEAPPEAPAEAPAEAETEIVAAAAPDADAEAAIEPEPVVEADPDPVPLSSVADATQITPTWELSGVLEPGDRPTIPPAVVEEDNPAEISVEERVPDATSAEAAPAPVMSFDAPDPDRTIRIPREEIEAALHASADDVVADRAPDPPAGPPWTPPAGLDGAIARFNARHMVLFKALRTEVGAGAVNFVRSCRSSLGDEANLFATAELHPDGSWDASELRRSVIEYRIDDVEGGFQKLLAQEVDMLTLHLGASRVGALMAQLSAIS